MKKRGVLIALTNAVEGREDEYNDWYSNVHLGDVLKMDGFVGARRYRVSGSQHVDAGRPWQYLAIYDVETEDFAEAARQLQERRGTDAMPISPALKEERLAWFFEEMK